jgi:hypothetical protein
MVRSFDKLRINSARVFHALLTMRAPSTSVKLKQPSW